MKIKLIENLSSYFSTQVLIIVFQLISVPVYLKTLGTDMYGELIVLSTIPAFLLLGEAGFGTVLNNEVIFRFSKKKYDAANRLVVSSVVISSIIYNILALIIFTILINSGYSLSYIDERMLLILCFFLWIGGFISILFGAFQSYFRAQNLHHINVYWTNITRLVETICPLILVLFKKDLFLILTIQVFLRITSFFLFYFFIKTKIKWFNFNFNYDNKLKEFSPYIAKSLYYFLFTFGQGLLIQGSTLLVGSKLGNSSVVQFNTIRTLVNSGKFIFGIINNSFLPELTKFISQGKKSLSISLFDLSVKTTFVLSAILSIFLFVFGEIIINIWTDYTIEINILFLNLLILEIMFFSSWFVGSNLLISINKHEYISKVFTISSILYFTIIYLFLEKLNIIIIPIALILMDLIMLFYVYKNLKNEFKVINLGQILFNYRKSYHFLKKIIKK